MSGFTFDFLQGDFFNMRMGFKKLFITISILLGVFFAFSAAEAVTLTAYADPASIEAGAQTTIYLQLRNDGGNTMMISSIDSNYSGFSFSYPYAIGPGEDGLCASTVNIPDSVLGQPMTFTVSWYEVDAFGNTVGTNSKSATVTVGKINTAALTATRTASVKQASPGETITITYVLTNSGSSPVTKVSLTDRDLQRKELFSGVTIEGGQSYTYELTYTMGYETVTSAPVINYNVGNETKSLTLTDLTLGMINSKLTVSVEQGVSGPEGVIFTIYLTNNGNQKISRISIKDEQGNKVNEETFALAIGESTTLSYTVPTDAERNVVFYITGKSGSGDAYEDKTSTHTVHKYIDPALIGLDFQAEVTETLNRNGSIKIRFDLNNTGVMTMYDVVLSEESIGEIRRTAELAPGKLPLEEVIYVGEPRDLKFNISMRDESNNTYNYTASLSASYIGVEEKPTASPEMNMIDEIGSLGSTISASVSKAVRTVLTVIVILTAVSGVALICLLILENRQKKEQARKKAMRDRALRERAARAAAVEGETVYVPRNPYAAAPPVRKPAAAPEVPHRNPGLRNYDLSAERTASGSTSAGRKAADAAATKLPGGRTVPKTAPKDSTRIQPSRSQSSKPAASAAPLRPAGRTGTASAPQSRPTAPRTAAAPDASAQNSRRAPADPRMGGTAPARRPQPQRPLGAPAPAARGSQNSSRPGRRED